MNLTPRQLDVLVAIRNYRHLHGYAPTMQELALETGTSVFLVSLSGFSSVQLHQETGDQAVQVHVVMGQHIPAHCSAGGLALLSCLSEADLNRALPAKLQPMTPESIKDKDQLRRELQRTRTRGYAINLGGWREDVGGLGVPLVVPGYPTAALNVSAPIYRLTKKEIPRIAVATREACAAIAARLKPATRASNLGSSRVT